nr:MAG TPA: methyltransferase-like protein [Caudoviricetes sp.]DAT51882.1 MAG TPA: methyltransferase-like protein [Caudoviricetes sp.]
MRCLAVSSFSSCSGRFALVDVSFDCVQFTEDFGQVARI